VLFVAKLPVEVGQYVVNVCSPVCPCNVVLFAVILFEAENAFG
jgi:hypothetical protein